MTAAPCYGCVVSVSPTACAHTALQGGRAHRVPVRFPGWQDLCCSTLTRSQLAQLGCIGRFWLALQLRAEFTSTVPTLAPLGGSSQH